MDAIGHGAATMRREAGLRTINFREIIRFAVVGVVNTLFSYSVYASMIFFGLSIALSNFIGLCVGIVFSFTTQGKIVFERFDLRRFPRFVISWAILYGCNTGLIYVLHGLGFNAYLAGALAVIPTTVLSFLAQKYFVFRASGVA